MKNGLAPGVRQASDFLMALQLTGAAKTDSLANLQVRLPVVVIGGGLTAIDTATEALAYYPLQVEKFLARYETLAQERGEAAVRDAWSAQDAEIADEFIAHARKHPRRARGRGARGPRAAVRRADRRLGRRHHRLSPPPDRFAELHAQPRGSGEGAGGGHPLRRGPHARGGRCSTSSAARGRCKSHPTRRLIPIRRADARCGHAGAHHPGGGGHAAQHRAGREEPQHVVIDGKYFRALDESGEPVTPERVAKPSAAHVLMSLRPDGRAISFFGDLHPSFAGNVVKAMASAKQGYPVVSADAAAATRRPTCRPRPGQAARQRAARDRARGQPPDADHRRGGGARAAWRRAPSSPASSIGCRTTRRWRRRVDGTTLAMEGLALTGAWVDREQGLLSTIVLEMGGSSDLCAHARAGRAGDPDGPDRTRRPRRRAGETVLLVGGGLGNAVLFSIGQALRAAGGHVLYFAGYKRAIDRYKVDEIERAADVDRLVLRRGAGLRRRAAAGQGFRRQHRRGDRRLWPGALGEPPIPLGDVDRIIAIGSDGMMAAVARARHGMLARHLKPGHRAIGSINSPMQCMMKEICAQCLQLHRDPVTGPERVVFSCFNQDQELDRVDFASLRGRLGQNGVQEKLTKLWIDRSLQKLGLRQVSSL